MSHIANGVACDFKDSKMLRSSQSLACWRASRRTPSRRFSCSTFHRNAVQTDNLSRIVAEETHDVSVLDKLLNSVRRFKLLYTKSKLLNSLQERDRIQNSTRMSVILVAFPTEFHLQRHAIEDSNAVVRKFAEY